MRSKLRAMGGGAAPLRAPRVHRAHGSKITLPRYYEVIPGQLIHAHVPFESLESLETLELAAALGESGNGSDVPELAEEKEHVRYPPAIAQEGAFNLVKFYGLERSLVHAVLSETFSEKLEFPFLPDEALQYVFACIRMHENG